MKKIKLLFGIAVFFSCLLGIYQRNTEARVSVYINPFPFYAPPVSYHTNYYNYGYYGERHPYRHRNRPYRYYSPPPRRYVEYRYSVPVERCYRDRFSGETYCEGY